MSKPTSKSDWLGRILLSGIAGAIGVGYLTIFFRDRPLPDSPRLIELGRDIHDGLKHSDSLEMISSSLAWKKSRSGFNLSHSYAIMLNSNPTEWSHYERDLGGNDLYLAALIPIPYRSGSSAILLEKTGWLTHETKYSREGLIQKAPWLTEAIRFGYEDESSPFKNSK